jgi:hypothetical protein
LRLLEYAAIAVFERPSRMPAAMKASLALDKKFGLTNEGALSAA